MPQTTHHPVLLEETIRLLGCRPGGRWVDGTAGGGGHAEAILRATAPDGLLLGCDRDAGSLERVRERLRPWADRTVLRHADFRTLPALLDEAGWDAADGILLDLGLSSLQLEDGERGFSFRTDGPLDMRMDRSHGRTAADLIRTLTEPELVAMLRTLGEEPAARAIARAIVARRAEGPIATTGRLAEIITGAVG
ncbi:MAG: 16S rRNA (cytosine(1402)-N(4))-methyltransferase RsmH, partial [Candidatus Polarisedimenticolia bacterium]